MEHACAWRAGGRTCTIDAWHALREAVREGLLDFMPCPHHPKVKCCDWYFRNEQPPFMHINGYVANARMVGRLRPGWRDELPYIWLKPGTGLPNPLDCYFVDPNEFNALLIVTNPYVRHDYEIGSAPWLARKYPCSVFLKRVVALDESEPNGEYSTTVYLPPGVMRTLKLVSTTDFIEGVYT